MAGTATSARCTGHTQTPPAVPSPRSKLPQQQAWIYSPGTSPVPDGTDKPSTRPKIRPRRNAHGSGTDNIESPRCIQCQKTIQAIGVLVGEVQRPASLDTKDTLTRRIKPKLPSV